MVRNYDLFAADGTRAVIYSKAAHRGTRIELGLQVWNCKTACWNKQLCTWLLPEDVFGLTFELHRLIDKAQAAGFSLLNTGARGR